MKHMFEMDEQGGLTIAPQVLMINEFAELAKSRGKKAKAKLNAELSAIWFFVDMRSPYMRMDDDERWDYIKDDVLYMFPKWEVDQHINACIDKYREMSRTRSMDTLESAWKAQTELDNFLGNVSLNERDNNGKPVFNAKQVMDMINSLPKTVKSLQDTQRLVETEVAENLILRGGREKAEFEDEGLNPD
jgi:hypothetical protein